MHCKVFKVVKNASSKTIDHHNPQSWKWLTNFVLFYFFRVRHMSWKKEMNCFIVLFYHFLLLRLNNSYEEPMQIQLLICKCEKSPNCWNASKSMLTKCILPILNDYILKMDCCNVNQLQYFNFFRRKFYEIFFFVKNVDISFPI